MSNRPKVLLLIPHLGGGGAERVFELLARHLPAAKYELHLGLATETPVTARPFAGVVAVHALGAARVRASAPALVRLVRALRPNLILSTMAHLNFLVLALRPLFPRETRILVRQNGTVSAMLADLRSPVFTRLLYRLLYPWADGVVCQSEAMAADLCSATGVSPRRTMVAPNPVVNDAGLATEPWRGAGPHLLAVGRLAPQKGFDLLLEAMARLRPRFPSLELAIAGAGAEEPALRRDVERLGLAKCVRLLGHVDAPSAYYLGANAFVASSRHEGMPNALLEAAAAGIPVVTTPSCAGVVELLRGQPGVWLADATTAESLAEALTEALDTLRPGQRFDHAWVRPYRVENAVAAYEALIDRTLCTRREVFA